MTNTQFLWDAATGIGLILYAIYVAAHITAGHYETKRSLADYLRRMERLCEKYPTTMRPR